MPELDCCGEGQPNLKFDLLKIRSAVARGLFHDSDRSVGLPARSAWAAVLAGHFFD